MKTFLTIIFFIFSFFAIGQNDSTTYYKCKTIELYDIFSEIQKTSDFALKMELSKNIEDIFDIVLYQNHSFFYSFDTLKNFMTCMYSDDKTW